MSRFIYEMVTCEHVNPGYRVVYRYENFFSSRRAAILYVTDYINWAIKNAVITEAVEMKWVSESKRTEVCWRTFKDNKVEYIGIKRHWILNN